MLRLPKKVVERVNGFSSKFDQNLEISLKFRQNCYRKVRRSGLRPCGYDTQMLIIGRQVGMDDTGRRCITKIAQAMGIVGEDQFRRQRKRADVGWAKLTRAVPQSSRDFPLRPGFHNEGNQLGAQGDGDRACLLIAQPVVSLAVELGIVEGTKQDRQESEPGARERAEERRDVVGYRGQRIPIVRERSGDENDDPDRNDQDTHVDLALASRPKAGDGRGHAQSRGG